MQGLQDGCDDASEVPHKKHKSTHLDHTPHAAQLHRYPGVELTPLLGFS
jgi:hypothetical protein